MEPCRTTGLGVKTCICTELCNTGLNCLCPQISVAVTSTSRTGQLMNCSNHRHPHAGAQRTYCMAPDCQVQDRRYGLPSCSLLQQALHRMSCNRLPSVTENGTALNHQQRAQNAHRVGHQFRHSSQLLAAATMSIERLSRQSNSRRES